MNKKFNQLIKIFLLGLILLTTTPPAASAALPVDYTRQPVIQPHSRNEQVAATSAQAEESLPVRIRIPAIEVDAEIEYVGKTRTGAMDVPKDVDNTAWYELGPTPGSVGNSVIAGHLDSVTGAPAVFWDLADLEAGDDVYVTDAGGTEHHFQVTKAEVYPYAKAPIAEIFGFTLESRLNLITCRGRWDRGRQTYTNRYVVYTELVESMPAE